MAANPQNFQAFLSVAILTPAFSYWVFLSMIVNSCW